MGVRNPLPTIDQITPNLLKDWGNKLKSCPTILEANC